MDISGFCLWNQTTPEWVLLPQYMKTSYLSVKPLLGGKKGIAVLQLKPISTNLLT